MSAQGWSGPCAELADEAMRVLPALAKARIRGDVAAAAVLFDGYRDDARRLGVPDDRAWLVFATAGVKWLARMMHREAIAADGDALEAADEAIAAAVEWAAHAD